MISKDIVGIFSFWVNWILLLDRSLEPEKSLLNLSNTSYLGGCINRRISLFEYFTSCWFLKIILKLTHKWKRHGEKNFCEQSTGSFRKHIIMIIISTWLFWETDRQSPLSFMHPTCVSLRYAHPVSISRHRTRPLQFYRWQIFAVEKTVVVSITMHAGVHNSLQMVVRAGRQIRTGVLLNRDIGQLGALNCRYADWSIR